VDSFDAYAADVDALAGLAAARQPGLPRFLAGHSMGGLVVLRHALRAPDGFAGVIASSPALATHPATRPSAPREALARLALRLAPRLRQPGTLDPRHLSRDPAVVAAYRADPLVQRRVSAGWYAAYRAAQAEVAAGAPRLALPALVMVAGEDRIVDPAASAAWAAAAPAGRVELVRWDGLFHELFQEPERERVVARARAFVEARLGGAPSSAA
jgi:lysophospholipase